MKFDKTLFKAKIFYDLKSRLESDELIQPRTLEVLICEAFGYQHVGDDIYYADGVVDNRQVSIKTRSMRPHVLKTKVGRDFQSNPESFIGPRHNIRHNKRTVGPSVIQRRQALDIDESSATPEEIGLATLRAFRENVEKSNEVYGTAITEEIIGIHGYDYTEQNYLVSLFWKEYKHLDPTKIEWLREGPGVCGYIKKDSNSYKVAARIDSNSNREATCFKEYKSIADFKYSAHIRVPVPDPWPFKKSAILKEIKEKEKDQ